MTEAEWLACPQPGPMIRFLNTGKVRERKLRLFAVACCLRIWEMIPEGDCRQGVILAESFADGRVDLETMQAASIASEIFSRRCQDRGDGVSEAVRAAAELVRLGIRSPTMRTISRLGVQRFPIGPESLSLNTVTRLPVEAVSSKAQAIAWEGYYQARLPVFVDRQSRLHWFNTHPTRGGPRWHARIAEELAQANLLRDILGNPFRRPTIDPTWLTWNDSTVPMLALAIYDDKAFDCLPILADALEEAGCSDSDILNHCRREGGHVRGCWVVDALLGRR